MIVEHMIARKRSLFGDDQRLIGEYKFVRRDGEQRVTRLAIRRTVNSQFANRYPPEGRFVVEPSTAISLWYSSASQRRTHPFRGPSALDEPRPWWLWPNLLSLDAPVVAVLWQSFLAGAAGLDVPFSASAALGLTVWGIYLADRWLDVRFGRQENTERHRFVARNLRFIAGLAALALLAAGAIAWLALPNDYLKVGAVVAGLAMLHFAAVHLFPVRPTGYEGLKELSVGAVFAIGVAVPLIATTARTDRQWVAGAIAFGGLCGMNCLLISRREECGSPAARPGWGALAASICAAGAAFGARWPVMIAVLASVGLLLGLTLAPAHVPARQLRVLADAALLSPIVVALAA